MILVRDPLLVVLVIAGLAWLLDRAWDRLRKERPQREPQTESTPPPREDRQTDTGEADPPAKSPSAELHKDWLQLGRRQKKSGSSG